MADFYLSPEDVQLIDEAVFRLFGRNLSNAGRIALENITDNQNQALTLATEANTRLDVLEPRVSGNESAIVDLQAADAATEIRMDALESADTALDSRVDSLELERIGTVPFTEGVQDVIGAAVAGSGSVNVAYDDPSGTTTVSVDADLDAIAALVGTGFPARTAPDIWAQREITAGNGVSVTNGDGVSGNPTISVDGTVQAISTKTGAYTATSGDEVLLCNGTFSLTLPAAASNTRRRYSVRNTGAGTVTIDPNAAELINGAATLALTGGQFVTIVCDGSAWFTIG